MDTVLSNYLWPLLITGTLFTIIALVVFKDFIYYCIYLVIFLLPLEDISVLFTDFTLIKFILLLTFGVWLLQILSKQRKFRFSKLSIFLILILLFATLSVIWSQDPSAALKSLFTLFQLILWVLMIVDLLDTEERIQTAGRIFILSSIITALIALILYQSGTLDQANRLAAFKGQNPNGFSRSLGFAFVMIIYSISTSYFSRSLLIKVLGTISIGAAIVLAVSRGTYIALVAPIFLLFFSSKIKRKLLTIIIFAVISWFIYYLFKDFIIGVLLPRLALYENLGGRQRIWRTALVMIKDNFLAGVGFGNFPVKFAKYSLIVSGWEANSGSHNVYVRILAELGFMGLFLFLSFHFMLLQKIFKYQGNPSMKVFLMAMLLYLIVGGMSTDLLLDKVYWFFFGLIIAVVEMEPQPKVLDSTIL